ncbi:hypothetical protein J7M23_00605 [Candidatus Sumerlaeota bacterium]|nr:hypothetical protein [Candidatus Sumerlaeota bacterium]
MDYIKKYGIILLGIHEVMGCSGAIVYSGITIAEQKATMEIIKGDDILW